MKVGIIAPIKSLKECCTTDVQYCIPSLIVESKPYREFYIAKQKQGNYIILDTCKVQWRREPESFSVVRQALEYIDPSIVVTPSYMYNLKKTLGIAVDFLSTFKPNFVAGCIEGTTTQEILDCIAFIKKLKVRTLAIPAHTYRLAPVVEDTPVVYLDNHSHPEELDGRQGFLVTSLPVRLGLDRGRLLSDYLPSPPALTFKEENKFPAIVKRNIADFVRFYEL